MALNFNEGFFGGVGGAVSDLFGAKGDKLQAQAYVRARDFSKQAAGLATTSAAIQELQTSRNIYKVIGSQQAAVAGAGLAKSGSALDLLRSSTMEGELEKQLIRTQGEIEKQGYLAEASAYQGQADAAKAAGKAKKASAVGNIISAGLALFGLSDRRLKENIQLLRTRADGINVYTFNYVGTSEVWEGVLAQEVQAVYPKAVSEVEGWLRVDYDAIGEVCRLVKEAA